MPEELWMKVYNTVQEAVTKSNPEKKKCNKAKWLSEEALQVSEKRTEAKAKEEKKKKKIYPAEFRVPKNSKKRLKKKKVLK